MTALLPAHRRAESFARLADSVSPVGADGRDARLLELVGALRTASALAPRPRADYVADLRARLLVEAGIVLVPIDRTLVLPAHTGRRPRRMSAAAAALVIVGGTAGASFAAQGSVPGDALYPVKRGIEQVHETFSFSDAARGRDLLQQADHRLDEVDLMLGNGGSDQAVSTALDSFTNSASQGARLLFTNYQANGDDASVASVRDFAGSDMGDLTVLSRRAPQSLKPDFARAAQLLTALDQQARVLCTSCGARAPLSTPSDLSLASGPVTLTRLLAVPSEPSAPTSTPNTAAPATRAAATARPTKKREHTAASPKVALPDLSGPLDQGSTSDPTDAPTTEAGTNDPTDAPTTEAGTNGETDEPGKAGLSNPLGGLLKHPSAGPSTGRDPGGLGSLDKKLHKKLGSLSSPIPKFPKS
ncbi:MAG: DUF5667 domain-containing protein [Marmoricola sp.]